MFEAGLQLILESGIANLLLDYTHSSSIIKYTSLAR